jgi:hypothetical protein
MSTQLPEIIILELNLAVYEADRLASLTGQLKDAPFYSITLSNGMISAVATRGLPGLKVLEPARHLLQIKNSANFQLELSKLVQVLGENDVGIIPMSNYEGDYILIKDEHLQTARRALSENGYLRE